LPPPPALARPAGREPNEVLELMRQSLSQVVNTAPDPPSSNVL